MVLEDQYREWIHDRLGPQLAAYAAIFYPTTPIWVRQEGCINAFVELFREQEPISELSNRTIYELSLDEVGDESVVAQLLPLLRNKLDAFVDRNQDMDEPTYEHDNGADIRVLLDACDKVDPTFRFIVWRHCFEKEPIDMIAKSLGLPQNDVRIQLDEIRCELRFAILNRYPSQD